MPRHDQVQRIRITFGVSEPLCYVSVLDMNRTWERLLNRARVPVSFSEGFNPHARLYLTAALPLGYCSTCEMLDIMLAEEQDASELTERLRVAAPPGLDIIELHAVELFDRAPIKGLHQAEYCVELFNADRAQVAENIEALLARKIVIRERIKKGKQREYDLRPLIHHIELGAPDETMVELNMRLACGSNGSGRPEEIIEELSLDRISRYKITRQALIWEKAVEEQP